MPELRYYERESGAALRQVIAALEVFNRLTEKELAGRRPHPRVIRAACDHLTRRQALLEHAVRLQRRAQARQWLEEEIVTQTDPPEAIVRAYAILGSVIDTDKEER